MNQTDNHFKPAFLDTDSFLKHWQGHRALTRKVFLAFPDDDLMTFSVGGMRPFAKLFQEMIQMAVPSLKGFATGNWETLDFTKEYTKDQLLDMWDKSTEDINTWWAKIPASKFQKNDKAFGQYEGKVFDLILYLLDNEIHHRAQGYVYLRALKIDPPFFWDRA